MEVVVIFYYLVALLSKIICVFIAIGRSKEAIYNKYWSGYYIHYFYSARRVP